MNIAQVTRLTGLTGKTIRYYDSIGLIVAAGREQNGYRVYTEQQVRELAFVQKAKTLGFSLDECRDLLELNRNKDRHSSDVKKIAQKKLDDVDQRIQQLQAVRQSLSHLVDSCSGDQDPDCNILASLSSGRRNN